MKLEYCIYKDVILFDKKVGTNYNSNWKLLFPKIFIFSLPLFVTVLEARIKKEGKKRAFLFFYPTTPLLLGGLFSGLNSSVPQ